MAPVPVVLASQSPYRRDLLARLVPDAITAAQHIDESPRPGETPMALAARLAASKARAGLVRYPGHIVIGSDQVASLGNDLLGKPGSEANAVRQLLRCSGQAVRFHTAVCVAGPGRTPDLEHIDLTTVYFRTFDAERARLYVAADAPLDCAGSFKIERRGVALLDRVETLDPTALQGLPLIWLARALESRGLDLY